ncbi:MAG: competence protein ComEC family protein [Candidatus Omnitrophica bacterium]|nr:competence protein ComEC family protein [Candidatus Omnitrophota bacterium]
MKDEVLILLSLVLGILSKEFPFLIFIFLIINAFLLLKNKKYFLLFTIFYFSGWFLATIHYKKNINNIDFSKINCLQGEVISFKENKFERRLVVKLKNPKTYVIVRTKIKKKFLQGENIKLEKPKIKAILNPRNPFEFNYKKFLERQGIFFQIESENIKVVKSKNLRLFFSNLRNKIERKIEENSKFHPGVCEIIKLLIIGSDDPADFIKELGIKSGIYHLFVISGLHIGFLIILLKLIFIPFQKINNVKPKLFPSLTLIILWFYNSLCGFRIPVTRAVLMVSFHLISEILEREIGLIKSFFFSCFLLLFLNPFYIYSTSFLLSYLATAGILLIPQIFNFNFKKNYIINLFIISLSAQISVLPIIFYNFGYFYPLGFINNLIFTPLVGFITALSFISLFFTPFFIILNYITFIFLKCLIFISKFSPQINIYFPLTHIFFYYTILSLLFSKIPKKPKFYLFLIFLTIFSATEFTFKDTKSEIIFFSFRNPVVLIKEKNKSLLILKGEIQNPDRIKQILHKISKHKKFKIKKIIVPTEQDFIKNPWISQLGEEIYIIENMKKLPKKLFPENEKINLEIREDRNILITKKKFKILIVLNEISNSPLKEKYYLIYIPKIYKNIGIFEKTKPLFYVFYQKTRKFEKLKSLCQNYYLEKSAIILNLETGILKYFNQND